MDNATLTIIMALIGGGGILSVVVQWLVGRKKQNAEIKCGEVKRLLNQNDKIDDRLDKAEKRAEYLREQLDVYRNHLILLMSIMAKAGLDVPELPKLKKEQYYGSD